MAAPELPFRRVSVRDPAGTVYVGGGRIFRSAWGDAADVATRFVANGAYTTLLDAKLVVGTHRLAAAPDVATAQLEAHSSDDPRRAWFEHDTIPFASYPYEWAPQMLHRAGELTLDVAEIALGHGFGLKDATPYNVLFDGSRPVFVDLLSFEERRPDDPTWAPYAQFCRSFLLPLIANRYFGIQVGTVFSGRREGLEPRDVYEMGRPLRRIFPPFFSLVTLPTWLAGLPHARKLAHRSVQPRHARFVLQSLFRHLRRSLGAVRPHVGHSRWSGYGRCNSYSAVAFDQKQRFVQEAIDQLRPTAVLDVGCNTGHFSTLAAESGARVVAIDSDPVVVGLAYESAARAMKNILPLVVDIARPTPSTGWNNAECSSFLDGARGGFDMVLWLAVVHHLVAGEAIPLRDVVRLAADLTRAFVVMEYVDATDPVIPQIARGREALLAELTPARFEAAVLQRFTIVRCLELDGATRRCYLLQKRPGLA